MAKASGFRPEDLFANNAFVTPEAGVIGSCRSHCPPHSAAAEAGCAVPAEQCVP
jgi:hypothetical protein